MLPILVLLVAASAIAAPSVQKINLIGSNSIGVNSLIDRAFDAFDGGDVTVVELNLGNILRDISRQGGNQALANGQAIAYLGEIASGRPGDACAAANYVNTYTRYVSSGNAAGVRDALRNYIQLVSGNIDNIVNLATNKEAVKYVSGARGGCPGEGRTYQFEKAWDIILGQNTDNLMYEESCVAKRMYCALGASNNNVGAHVTASALPPTKEVFNLVSGQLVEFLSRLPTKDNLGRSAASLKQALVSAVGRVTL